MKKVFLLIPFVLILLFPPLILAHPGRTAADGCHYCRTNCDKWGELWNVRHCHSGGSDSIPIIQKTTPVYIPSMVTTEQIKAQSISQEKNIWSWFKNLFK